MRAALARLPGLDWREADADRARTVLQLIHTPDYIADVLTPIAPGADRQFDPDTFAMQYTGAGGTAFGGGWLSQRQTKS